MLCAILACHEVMEDLLLVIQYNQLEEYFLNKYSVSKLNLILEKYKVINAVNIFLQRK